MEHVNFVPKNRHNQSCPKNKKKKKQKKHTQQQKHTNNSSHFNFLLNECHQIKLFKGTVKGKIEKALINGRLRCFKSIIKTSLSNY